MFARISELVFFQVTWVTSGRLAQAARERVLLGRAELEEAQAAREHGAMGALLRHGAGPPCCPAALLDHASGRGRGPLDHGRGEDGADPRCLSGEDAQPPHGKGGHAWEHAGPGPHPAQAHGGTAAAEGHSGGRAEEVRRVLRAVRAAVRVCGTLEASGCGDASAEAAAVWWVKGWQRVGGPMGAGAGGGPAEAEGLSVAHCTGTAKEMGLLCALLCAQVRARYAPAQLHSARPRYAPSYTGLLCALRLQAVPRIVVGWSRG
jgi:hypothetical protein